MTATVKIEVKEKESFKPDIIKESGRNLTETLKTALERLREKYDIVIIFPNEVGLENIEETDMIEIVRKEEIEMNKG